MQDRKLADFQALLLDALYEHEKAEDIVYRLKCQGQSADFEEWIKQLDPTMLEVGAELVKKWGKK